MSGRTSTPATPRVRCAIYTRKSSDEGLDQEFNSLDDRDARPVVGAGGGNC